MIIEKLTKLYDILEADPDSDISPMSYAKVPVSHEIIIDEDGEILAIVDLRDIQESKKAKSLNATSKLKLMNKHMDVPIPPKRSSGIDPAFLCDYFKYVLGIPSIKDTDKDTLDKHFEEFRKYNIEILKDTNNKRAKAFKSFLSNWTPSLARQHPVVAPIYDDLRNCAKAVFRLNGDSEYIHQNSEIKEIWENYYNNMASETGTCIITGKQAKLADLHYNIKGVPNGQAAGIPLVSFNFESTESYGKIKSMNAPISKEVVFKYTTAWNHLASSSTNTIRFENFQMVFWAETKAAKKGNLFIDLLCPTAETKEKKSKKKDEDESDLDSGVTVIDKDYENLIADVLYRAKNGMPIMYEEDSLDSDSKFYILGYTGNIGRIAIKFLYENTFGNIIGNIEQHILDMQVMDGKGFSNIIPAWKVFKDIAPLGKVENIAPAISDAYLQSVLFNRPYPKEIFMMALNRCRRAGLTYSRMCIIKAYLARENRRKKNLNRKVDDITMSLDKESKNIAYNLGRLFAVLENVQWNSQGNINSTIKDKYFKSAYLTPQSIFPLLLAGSNNHLSKMRKDPKKVKLASIAENRINEIIGNIGCFPRCLTMEEQGMFMLGYYQQRPAIYEKSSGKEKDEFPNNDIIDESESVVNE